MSYFLPEERNFCTDFKGRRNIYKTGCMNVEPCYVSVLFLSLGVSWEEETLRDKLEESEGDINDESA